MIKGRSFPVGRCVIDFETDGLHPHDGARPFIVGMEDEAGNVRKYRPSDPGWDRVFKGIAEDSKIYKISQGTKFELKHCWHMGITPRGPWGDTMALAVLLDEYQRINLDALSKRWLGDESKGVMQDWLKTNTRRLRKELDREPNYSDVPADVMEPYLEGDLDRTLRLMWKFEHVERRFPELYKMETDLAWDIAAMEDRGIRIDLPYVEAEIRRLRPEMGRIESELIGMAGVGFNPASHRELGEVMRSMGLDTGETNKDGSMKTEFKLLEAMESHPFVDKLIRWRGLSKIVGTYLVPFTQMACGDTVHGSFWQYGQDDAIVTGRLSSSSPNLQNIPGGGRSTNKVLIELGPIVRRAIIPPLGHALLFFDYKQIEQVIFTCYARDDRAMADLRAGVDPYVAQGKLMLGADAFDGLGKDEFKRKRFQAKELCLSFIYGMGLRAFARRARLELGEARRRRDQYFRNSPATRDFMIRATRDLLTDGHVEDAFGRRYHVPQDRAYKAVNALCQGSAATVMKKGIIRARGLAGLGVKPIMTIHDELCCIVPLENIREAAEEGKRLLRDDASFEVPIEVSAAWSDTNWAEKRELP